MARPARIQYEGAVYHVMSRGDRREPIFLDDDDRRLFLDALGAVCERTGWRVHAYVLMQNHFHLVVETPRPNLVEGMKWLLGVYTGRFNRRHGLVGHLFAGRYKAIVVDAETQDYFRVVTAYVHLNPARAGLITNHEPLHAYRWSSWPAYVSKSEKRPAWLAVDRLMGAWDIPKDSPAGRQRLEKALEQLRGGSDPDGYKAIRRGWCLGEESFRRELLRGATNPLGPQHFGDVRRESDEEKAIRILNEELKQLGWTSKTLAGRRKGDGEKVRIAARIRRETVMPMQWIVSQLHMGTVTYAHSLLRRKAKVNDSKN
jgi:putative transposase